MPFYSQNSLLFSRSVLLFCRIILLFPGIALLFSRISHFIFLKGFVVSWKCLFISQKYPIVFQNCPLDFQNCPLLIYSARLFPKMLFFLPILPSLPGEMVFVLLFLFLLGNLYTNLSGFVDNCKTSARNMIFYVFHTNFSLHDSLENAVFLAFGMTEISPPQRGSYIVPKHPAVLCTAYSSAKVRFS